MKHQYLFFLIIVLVASSLHIQAQRAVIADTVWCDNLNNIIRCVSMKQIFEPVGEVKDSSDIWPFVPKVRLTRSDAEVIQKKNGKVNYIADIQSTRGPLTQIEGSLNTWYQKVRGCLAPWDMARLANRDKSISYQDYFLTNSEDETTVRLSIIHDNAYHVRITIY